MNLGVLIHLIRFWENVHIHKSLLWLIKSKQNTTIVIVTSLEKFDRLYWIQDGTIGRMNKCHKI